MMHEASLKSDVVNRLQNVLTGADLPPRALKTCRGLLEKLNAPVRIGLFGLPGAGKKTLLNGMLGQTIVPVDRDVPTLQLVAGSQAQTSAMLADGAQLDAPGYPAADLLAEGPVFLTVSSPICAKAQRTYLLVVCEDDPSDLVAGLQWAACRIDLAVWCTRGWSEREAKVWQTAPEDLQDHAILCLNDPGSKPIQSAPGFEAVVHLDGGPVEIPVSQRLQAITDEAVTQDLLAAELFLSRYGLDAPEAPEVPKAPATVHTLPQASLADPVSEQAKTELAQLFRFVRNAALDMRRRLARAPCGAPDILQEFETVFETLADQALDLDHMTDTWPELGTTLEDARDLALLLRMEGGIEQAEDAARLLLQLRFEMETKLAA